MRSETQKLSDGEIFMSSKMVFGLMEGLAGAEKMMRIGGLLLSSKHFQFEIKSRLK